MITFYQFYYHILFAGAKNRLPNFEFSSDSSISASFLFKSAEKSSASTPRTWVLCELHPGKGSQIHAAKKMTVA